MEGPELPRHRNSWLIVAVVTAVVSAVLFTYGAVIRHTGELSHGFAAYYTSARLVLDGERPAAFYENRWFLDQTIRFGFGDTPDIYNINPPTTSLIMLPLAWLTPAQVDVIWSLFNIGFLAVSVWFLLKSLDLAGFDVSWSKPLPWLLIAIALLYNPIYLNFRFGQAYLLVLMLISIAFWAYLNGRGWLVGFMLGLALLLKSAGLLVWLVPLLDRRFRVLGWSIGTVVAGIFISSPLLGLNSWWEYVQWLPGLTDRPSTGVTAYQTIASIVRHLTRLDEMFSPQPIVNIPWLWKPLSTAVVVGLVAAAIFAGWIVARDISRPKGQLLRLAMFLALTIPLQPVGEEHSFTLLLPVVFVALGLVSEEPSGGLRGELIRFTAIAGVLLLAVPLPFLSDRLIYGWKAILAYPKLYGALLLAMTMIISLADDPHNWRDLVRQRASAVRSWRSDFSPHKALLRKPHHL